MKTEGGGLGGYEMEGDPMCRHRHAGGQGVVEIGIGWTLVEEWRGYREKGGSVCMNLGFKVICKMIPSKKEKERKRRRERDEEKERAGGGGWERVVLYAVTRAGRQCLR